MIVNEVVGGLSAGTEDQRGSASGHRCGLDTTIIVAASSCPSRFLLDYYFSYLEHVTLDVVF